MERAIYSRSPALLGPARSATASAIIPHEPEAGPSRILSTACVQLQLASIYSTLRLPTGPCFLAELNAHPSVPAFAGELPRIARRQSASLSHLRSQPCFRRAIISARALCPACLSGQQSRVKRIAKRVSQEIGGHRESKNGQPRKG